MLDDLRRWYAYNEWATSRLLSAVLALPGEALHRDLGTSFGTLNATLVHMLKAEWLWLERFEGRNPSAVPELGESDGIGAIAERWREVARGQHAFLDSASDETLAAPLAYTNLAGEPRVYALGDVLRHVVNHATYHRGQVASALRQLGAAAPSTDFTLFLDQAALSGAASTDSAPHA
jgi:uncharacterized damage-inducible protein DinB